MEGTRNILDSDNIGSGLSGPDTRLLAHLHTIHETSSKRKSGRFLEMGPSPTEREERHRGAEWPIMRDDRDVRGAWTAPTHPEVCEKPCRSGVAPGVMPRATHSRALSSAGAAPTKGAPMQGWCVAHAVTLEDEPQRGSPGRARERAPTLRAAWSVSLERRSRCCWPRPSARRRGRACRLTSPRKHDGLG